MSRLAFDTLLGARDAIAAKKIGAVELVKQAIDRIGAFEPSIQAFNSVWGERAIARAREVDEGKRTGPLAGVPIAVKDNMCTAYGRTTCSSKMLENFRSPYDATVVKRLEEAGAVIVGKTNLDEFAMGSSTENSAFKTTRNPWDVSRVPGGSSGGSAAALAAGFCCASVGSDTGGSIRQPAALCGVAGMKPTYGRVSRYGLIAFASSLDQIGPFSWNAADAGLLLGLMGGHDRMDSTSVADAVPDYLAEMEKPVKGLRIGIAREYNIAGMDPQVQKAVDEAISVYRRLGAEVVDVTLPHTEYGIAAYYVIAPSEASSNLARYDGVHFGHRTSAKVENIVDLMSRSRAEGFGEEVQRRIMIGSYMLSSGYDKGLYPRALAARTLILRDFVEAFEKCDVILCPTTPTAAFKAGEKTGDPLQMYLCDIFTVTCNIAGIAGVSIPCGFTAGEKPLPIGLQLLGPMFSEESLMRIWRMYERETDWHTRRPELEGRG